MERINAVFNFLPGSNLCRMDGCDYGLHFLKKVQLIGEQWVADGKEVSMEELVSLGYAEKINNE